MHCFSRPLPSLESPQLEFLTPTEEITALLRQEEIPQLEQAAEETTEIPPLDLLTKPEPLKKTSELPEPTHQTEELPEPTHQTAELSGSTQSTNVELPEETKKLELSEPTKKEEGPPEEFPEPIRGPLTSPDIVEEPAELLEPIKSTVEVQEPTKNELEFPVLTKNEEPEQPKTTTEPPEPEKELISEQPEELVEKPGAIPPCEPFKVPAEEPAVTETVQDPAEELQDSG